MECMNRKSLLKLHDLIKTIDDSWDKGDNHSKQIKLTKLICKCHWLFEHGCEIVEDWVMAQSNLNKKVAVPWVLSLIPGEIYQTGTRYFITLPEELARKILVFGIPETQIEKEGQVSGIIDWCMGKKTFDQLQKESFSKISE